MQHRFQPIQLDDGSIDWQAVLPVRISNPLHPRLISPRLEVLVDSGSTDCIFPADVLNRLGLSLESGAPSGIVGVSGAVEMRTHYQTVTLHIENHEIRVVAAFAPRLCVAGILGRRGFFDQFRVVFDIPANPLTFSIERPAPRLLQV